MTDSPVYRGEKDRLALILLANKVAVAQIEAEALVGKKTPLAATSMGRDFESNLGFDIQQPGLTKQSSDSDLPFSTESDEAYLKRLESLFGREKEEKIRTEEEEKEAKEKEEEEEEEEEAITPFKERFNNGKHDEAIHEAILAAHGRSPEALRKMSIRDATEEVEIIYGRDVALVHKGALEKLSGMLGGGFLEPGTLEDREILNREFGDAEEIDLSFPPIPEGDIADDYLHELGEVGKWIGSITDESAWQVSDPFLSDPSMPKEENVYAATGLDSVFVNFRSPDEKDNLIASLNNRREEVKKHGLACRKLLVSVARDHYRHSVLHAYHARLLQMARLSTNFWKKHYFWNTPNWNDDEEDAEPGAIDKTKNGPPVSGKTRANLLWLYEYREGKLRDSLDDFKLLALISTGNLFQFSTEDLDYMCWKMGSSRTRVLDLLGRYGFDGLKEEDFAYRSETRDKAKASQEMGSGEETATSFLPSLLAGRCLEAEYEHDKMISEKTNERNVEVFLCAYRFSGALEFVEKVCNEYDRIVNFTSGSSEADEGVEFSTFNVGDRPLQTKVTVVFYVSAVIMTLLELGLLKDGSEDADLEALELKESWIAGGQKPGPVAFDYKRLSKMPSNTAQVRNEKLVMLCDRLDELSETIVSTRSDQARRAAVREMTDMLDPEQFSATRKVEMDFGDYEIALLQHIIEPLFRDWEHANFAALFHQVGGFPDVSKDSVICNMLINFTNILHEPTYSRTYESYSNANVFLGTEDTDSPERVAFLGDGAIEELQNKALLVALAKFKHFWTSAKGRDSAVSAELKKIEDGLGTILTWGDRVESGNIDKETYKGRIQKAWRKVAKSRHALLQLYFEKWAQETESKSNLALMIFLNDIDPTTSSAYSEVYVPDTRRDWLRTSPHSSPSAQFVASLNLGDPELAFPKAESLMVTGARGILKVVAVQVVTNLASAVLGLTSWSLSSLGWGGSEGPGVSSAASFTGPPSSSDWSKSKLNAAENYCQTQERFGGCIDFELQSKICNVSPVATLHHLGHVQTVQTALPTPETVGGAFVHLDDGSVEVDQEYSEGLFSLCDSLRTTVTEGVMAVRLRDELNEYNLPKFDNFFQKNGTVDRRLNDLQGNFRSEFQTGHVDHTSGNGRLLFASSTYLMLTSILKASNSLPPSELVLLMEREMATFDDLESNILDPEAHRTYVRDRLPGYEPTGMEAFAQMRVEKLNRFDVSFLYDSPKIYPHEWPENAPGNQVRLTREEKERMEEKTKSEGKDGWFVKYFGKVTAPVAMVGSLLVDFGSFYKVGGFKAYLDNVLSHVVRTGGSWVVGSLFTNFLKFDVWKGVQAKSKSYKMEEINFASLNKAIADIWYRLGLSSVRLATSSAVALTTSNLLYVLMDMHHVNTAAPVWTKLVIGGWVSTEIVVNFVKYLQTKRRLQHRENMKKRKAAIAGNLGNMYKFPPLSVERPGEGWTSYALSLFGRDMMHRLMIAVNLAQLTTISSKEGSRGYAPHSVWLSAFGSTTALVAMFISSRISKFENEMALKTEIDKNVKIMRLSVAQEQEGYYGSIPGRKFDVQPIGKFEKKKRKKAIEMEKAIKQYEGLREHLPGGTGSSTSAESETKKPKSMEERALQFVENMDSRLFGSLMGPVTPDNYEDSKKKMEFLSVMSTAMGFASLLMSSAVIVQMAPVIGRGERSLTQLVSDASSDSEEVKEAVYRYATRLSERDVKVEGFFTDLFAGNWSSLFSLSRYPTSGLLRVTHNTVREVYSRAFDWTHYWTLFKAAPLPVGLGLAFEVAAPLKETYVVTRLVIDMSKLEKEKKKSIAKMMSEAGALDWKDIEIVPKP
jgi:hypothetical protein